MVTTGAKGQSAKDFHDVAQAAPPDAVTVVFLTVVDVPGYGVYRPGDVASFERKVARDLIERGWAGPEGTTPPEPERPRMVGSKEIRGTR
jgi:hypothetical protein